MEENQKLETNDSGIVPRFSTIEETPEYKKLLEENKALIKVIKILGGIGFCSYCVKENTELTDNFNKAMDEYGELVVKKV